MEERAVLPMDLAKSTSPSASTGGIDISAPPFQRGRSALRLLYDACCYAQQLNRSVGILRRNTAGLRKGGLTNGDLRWLVCNGVVEHGREITKIGEERREFQRTVGLHFSKKTCFVLTDEGTLYVKECLAQPAQNGSVLSVPRDTVNSQERQCSSSSSTTQWNPRTVPAEILNRRISNVKSRV